MRPSLGTLKRVCGECYVFVDSENTCCPRRIGTVANLSGEEFARREGGRVYVKAPAAKEEEKQLVISADSKLVGFGQDIDDKPLSEIMTEGTPYDLNLQPL